MSPKSIVPLQLSLKMHLKSGQKKVVQPGSHRRRHHVCLWLSKGNANSLSFSLHLQRRWTIPERNSHHWVGKKWIIQLEIEEKTCGISGKWRTWEFLFRSSCASFPPFYAAMKWNEIHYEGWLYNGSCCYESRREKWTDKTTMASLRVVPPCMESRVGVDAAQNFKNNSFLPAFPTFATYVTTKPKGQRSVLSWVNIR